jgi:ribosome-binding protein aMBF1 (putative translation factor)
MPVVCRQMNRQANADRIRRAREAVELSTTGLAYKAGLSLRTIERIEAGEVKPRPSTLRVIAWALDVDERELWDELEEVA